MFRFGINNEWREFVLLSHRHSKSERRGLSNPRPNVECHRLVGGGLSKAQVPFIDLKTDGSNLTRIKDGED